MVQKAYKFRIYPNKTQTILLNKTFGCVRYAWNSWVDVFNNQVDKVFKTPKQFKEEIDWMCEVSSAALQQKERDFKEFKTQFFNKRRKLKLGAPNFKSRNKRQSYRLCPDTRFTVNQDTGKIRLEKIGWVRAIFDRVIPDNVKFRNVIISKDLVGDYFVSILVEKNIDIKPKTGKSVGVDVGLKHFATLSTGEAIANPRYFRESQSKLKRVQQHFARKTKGSKCREQTRIQVAKVHRKIDRQRTHFLHNVSSYLVNHFDVIAIEDLNVAGMVKNHKLAKSISDASWSTLFNQLEYKCAWYGKTLQKCKRFEPTSKTCNVCGHYYKDMTLDIRIWKCPDCSVYHDRDVNAAKNILKKAVGVDAELQTWRDGKTPEDSYSVASPCEASRMT